MEYQSFWAGRPAEHLDCSPSSTQTLVDVPQSSSAAATSPSFNKIWTPSRLKSASQGQQAWPCESWKRPIETLVQRLKRHSLKSRRDGTQTEPCHVGFTIARPELPPQQNDDLMDLDADLGPQQTSAPPRALSSSMDDGPRDLSISLKAAKPRSGHLQAGTPCVKPASEPQSRKPPSISVVPEIQTALRLHAWGIVEAPEDLTSDDLSADEGYGDDLDDFARDADGHHLIRSLANHARTSGVLKYRTSAEAALSCPQIVHRAPRMRRRRQRKQQTRLRTCSTASTCGFDSSLTLENQTTGSP